MAFNLDGTTEDDVLTAIRDRVANGDLRIGTASMAAVLATFGLSATGGTVSTQVWTLAFDATTVAASATGTAAAAELRDSGGTVRVSGLTVGTGSEDVVIDNTSITSGQNVTVTGSATVGI